MEDVEVAILVRKKRQPEIKVGDVVLRTVRCYTCGAPRAMIILVWKLADGGAYWVSDLGTRSWDDDFEGWLVLQKNRLDAKLLARLRERARYERAALKPPTKAELREREARRVLMGSKRRRRKIRRDRTRHSLRGRGKR